MKENRIPFDIKYRQDIEAGRYRVETRDGRPARIVCWDFKAQEGALPIIAIVSYDGYERAFLCSNIGRTNGIADDCDLFLVPVEQDACTITGWVARDAKGNSLWFHFNKPERGLSAWNCVGVSGCVKLVATLFPEITWEDEPIEVTLTIKRKEETK